MEKKKRTRMTKAQRRRARLKKWGWGAVIVIALAILLHNPANASTFPNTDGKHEINYLEQSFKATNAIPNGYLLHDWSTLNQKFTDEQNLSKIGRLLEQELAVQNAKTTMRSSAQETFYEIDGTWPNQTAVRIVLSSFLDTPGAARTGSDVNVGSTVLVISAESASFDANSIAEQYQAIENAVRKVGADAQISACLEGYLNDRIVGVHARNIVDDAYKAVRAVPIEGLNSQLETSISGYSPEGLTYILSNGKRMNLQVAVHADAYHHRTNVLVGTPIITTTY